MFLETGVVIGLNQWPKYGFRQDLWLCVDSDIAMRDYPDIVNGVSELKYMQRYKHMEKLPPADYFFEKSGDEIPLIWEERLSWSCTCATAAANLAVILGATEIVLYGVDLSNDGRADGTQYDEGHNWDTKVDMVNKWFHRLTHESDVLVYKTNPASPLNLPLYKWVR
jgi:hypothetical protein